MSRPPLPIWHLFDNDVDAQQNRPRHARPDEVVAVSLEDLEHLTSDRERLDQEEADRVADARAGGASWEEIAVALGITRQAAMKRHATMVAERSSATTVACQRRTCLSHG